MDNVTYTDEPMQLGEEVTERFPPTDVFRNAPIEIVRSTPEEGEELVMYRKRSGRKIHAVRRNDAGELEVEFDDGFVFVAPVEKDAKLDV